MNKEILKNLARMISATYWKDTDGDCGSDYDDHYCEDCRHNFYCKNAKEFYDNIDKEK